jgi:hypothetical protein
MNTSVALEATNRTLVVLLEGGFSSKASVREWLTEDGFRTWEANDVCHAFEELSDFTVKMRPDAVLLDVLSMDDSFDNLRSAFQLMSEKDGITVLGLCEGSEVQRPLVAGNLNQLKRIIRREVRQYPAAV